MEKHTNYCYKCIFWLFNGNRLLGMGYCKRHKFSYRRWCQSCKKFSQKVGQQNLFDFIPDDSHKDIYKGALAPNE